MNITPTPRATADDYKTVFKDINKQYIFWSLGLIGALFLFADIMLSINVAGNQALLLIPFFVSSILVFVVGTTPLAIGFAALLGVTLSAVQLNNPIRGAADGVVVWLTQIVPIVIYSFQLICGFLAVVPFGAEPVLFYYMVAACFTIVSALIVHEKFEGEWLFIIVLWFSIAVLIGAFLILGWKTVFGDEAPLSSSSQSETVVTDVPPQTSMTGLNFNPVLATPRDPVVFDGACEGDFTDALNCDRVVMYAGSALDWVVDKTEDDRFRCIHFNPGGAIRHEPLLDEAGRPAGATFWYTGSASLEYSFYEVPVGETGPDGRSCD